MNKEAEKFDTVVTEILVKLGHNRQKRSFSVNFLLLISLRASVELS
jgi:hypothetical protein